VGVLPSHTTFGLFVMIVLLPLFPALPGALFLPLLSCLPAFFFCGDGGVRNDADTRWQSLLLAFFLSPLNVDVDIVRIAPFLLELSTLLPETAFVEAFCYGSLSQGNFLNV
jgi:hypothetical protein